MFFKRNIQALDTSFFEDEHDLDLVAMINNARTEDDIQSIARMCKARMRARRKAARAAR
jgi:hypothetical protein